MKPLGYFLILCLLVSVLQLAVTGLAILLLIALVAAFVARTRELVALTVVGAGGMALYHYPTHVLGLAAASGVALAVARSWARNRRRRRIALLPPPPPRSDDDAANA